MKKAFLFSFILFLFLPMLFSQNTISTELEKKLELDKYSLERELLKGSLSLDFPYNIIISSKNEHILANNKDKICIIFSQKDLLQHYDALRPLFDALDEGPFYTEILLSANDEKLHPSFEASLQGIQTYIENNLEYENLHTILIDFQEKKLKKGLSIDIGTKNHLAPLPLVRSFIHSLEKNTIPYTIEGGFSSLVRLGFTSENPVLAFLQNKEIPALALNTDENNIAETVFLLTEHIKNYNPNSLVEESSQYSFFYIFEHFFSISEIHLVALIIILAFLTLLIIVFFPFLLGKNRFLHKEEFSKSWPLLPLLILLNAFFFYISQPFMSLLFPHFESLPQFAFLIKIIISLLFLFLISLAQIIFKFPLSTFIYGYLGSFIAFINIFVFTFIDISLFIPFSFEFLIILITSSFKKRKNLFLTIALMVLPFLPYLLFTDGAILNNIFRIASRTSFIGNVLLALLLIPFQIVWIKILIRMKHFGKQKGVTFKRILIDVLMNLGAIFFVVLFIQILIHTDTIPKTKLEKTKEISTTDKSFIEHVSNHTINYDTEDIECIIESSLPVLRYEIKIHSASLLPIYEANYPYDILTEQEWALFHLDDYPPNPLLLRFSSDASLDKRLYITAYLLDGNEVVKTEEDFFYRGIDDNK